MTSDEKIARFQAALDKFLSDAPPGIKDDVLRLATSSFKAGYAACADALQSQIAELEILNAEVAADLEATTALLNQLGKQSSRISHN